MDSFSEQLNEIFVDTFRTILKVEEQVLKNSAQVDISISEMHVIESVAKSGSKGKSISDIAEDLGITLPSVTIAINKLVKKGYVNKVKCDNDGRVVYVILTKQGQKTNAAHRYFHENMVRQVAEELTEQEKSCMLKGMIKLNAFFNKKLTNLED